MQGLVIKHTDLITQELRNRYAAKPEDELDVWISTAQQREAMVVQLYDLSAVSQRLPRQSEDIEPLAEVVRKTIGGIWAQEASHTTLIRTLRRIDDGSVDVVETARGVMEGITTHWATTHGVLAPVARWLVGVARAVGQAPEFTQHLSTLSLGQFLLFSNELEQTAAQGYTRVLELIDEIEAKSGPSLKFGLTQRYEIAKTLAEERFHAAVFERLRAWLSRDGTRFEPREAATAVASLRRLAAEKLSLRMIRELPAEAQLEGMNFTDGVNEPLISDGGLGALFESFQEHVIVAEAPRE